MILRIFQMIATSGILIVLEFTKFVFGRGSAPHTAVGAYSASPHPITGLRGPTSKAEGRERRKGRRRADERTERDRPTYANSLIRP